MDWVDHCSELSLRVFLYIVFSWLDKQTPFIRYIEEEELWMYRYPSLPSIVPKWSLYLLLIIIPAIIFLIEYMINQKPKEIIKGVYALTLVYMMNGIFTVTLKLLVGRPRPNFFMRCFPDGYGTDINNCTGEYKGYMDDSGRHKGWKCLLVSIPVIIAVLIGVSRTCDYHHHYSDILFGAIMGMGISYSVYYAYYWSEDMLDEEIVKSLTKI
ncbi:hypothetical protein ABEB36_004118 [Hypothenemus hampei]|uniref:Phosphatidic acid phosphatase type 2/haloperoxidase domain-containing protein n=1 Tax=Hypothenemus hampei TaxID=57062 RepID=A0ABD1F3M1_HYPHA